MVLNTTTGAVEVPRGTRSHINTTAVLEPPLMAYEDESPEIISVLSAAGWQAVIADEAVPLVVWVALDTGRMHGVVVGVNGCIDLNADVEKHPHFTGYKQANINDKE
jgi:hypothetical protein